MNIHKAINVFCDLRDGQIKQDTEVYEALDTLNFLFGSDQNNPGTQHFLYDERIPNIPTIAVVTFNC